MRVITAAMALSGALSVVAAGAPAQAHEDENDGGWRQHEWREHQWREQRWREHEWHERARQAYAPPPVFYAPPSYNVPPAAYYVPPPGYYAVPPRVYYAPPPPPPIYEPPGVSIGFGFGFR